MKTLTFQTRVKYGEMTNLLGSVYAQVSSRGIVMVCPSSLCSCWIAADPECKSCHLLVLCWLMLS